ncbi:hypothetical protein ABT297_34940 [Dactylosporangium sp. NPDC000555]|uniref:hypothetical protein n=1 Tax=Dactylosporangium sp. NPDC000555 TaxID=3154260 RepID=UPI0033164E00
MATLLQQRGTLVSPTYRLFALHDPECDDSSNFEVSTIAAINDTVGWAYGMVSISTVLDIVNTTVHVEVWDADPGPAISAADLEREAELDFPSGRYCIDKATNDQDRLGIDLPHGPGMYRVHITGQRAEARDRRDRVYAHMNQVPLDVAAPEIEGLETYLLRLWRVGESPPEPVT